MYDHFPIITSLSFGVVALLVAGVFQAFSDFIMAGLKRADAAAGVQVMQHINRTVLRSVFLISLLGLAPLSMGFALYAIFDLSGGPQLLIFTAALLYVSTVVLVTIGANVPRNEHLDAVTATSDKARAYWSVYVREWTRWNHVRTLGAATTGILYLVAAAQLTG